MAKIANSVPLGGFIAPNDSADTYATHDEQYGRGGFRSVATTTERNAIPADRRKLGMEVKVLADGKKYELVGGIENSNWQEVVTGGQVDPTLITQAVNNAVPTAVSSALETEINPLLENKADKSELENKADKSVLATKVNKEYVNSVISSLQQGDSKFMYHKISISGTGKEETDYIMRLELHRGEKTGSHTARDIFLDNGCRKDFTDIRFCDAERNIIPHQIVAKGNYEVIHDKKLGSKNVLYQGKIYSNFDETGDDLFVSEDNGETWTLVHKNRQIIAINTKGYLFARQGQSVFMRSTDDGATWTTVLTLPTGSYIQTDAWAEDSTGVLYAGQYQDAYDPVIYKSTDDGATWETAYSGTEDQQHVHGIFVDPYTDYIYASFDGAIEKITMMRSIDHGVTWTTLFTDRRAAFTHMVATPTARFFSGGAQGPNSGSTLMKTTDDLTIETVLRTSVNLQGLKILGNHMYAFGVTYGNTPSAIIYQLDLDGTNAKSILIGENDDHRGFNGWDNCDIGIPLTSTEEQIITGYRDYSTSVEYNAVRVYDGGDHHQATTYIKIPKLPPDGMDIYIMHYDLMAADASEDVYGELIATPNPIIHYKLNEGEGTAIVNQASPGTYDGTITVDTGEWNDYGLRYCGNLYPRIFKGSNSYKFKGGVDYITIGGHTPLNSKLTKNFSFVAWIKTENVNVNQTIFAKFTTGAGGFRFQTGGSNGNLRFRIDDVANGISKQAVHNAPFGVAVGHEVMVGVIVSDDDIPKVRFISNGVISEEKELPGAIIQSTGTPRIGISYPTSEKFIGDIGEVQLYDYQLTPLQVQQLYENRLLAETEPEIINMESEDFVDVAILKQDILPGTTSTTTITGSTITIEHKDQADITIRTDTITRNGDILTEIRELPTGQKITKTVNVKTLETEVLETEVE